MVQTFEARLIKDDKTSGASVIIPAEIFHALGKQGRIPVKGTIDGRPFEGTIFPYGGVHYLGVKKEIRDAIGKTHGDSVRLAMEADEAPRVVKVPEDLALALAGDEKAKEAFEKLSYSHRKEYVAWIDVTKKEETRQRRITKTIEKLKEGKP